MLIEHLLATSEGLDAFISTTYYSRIRFITQLLPLLTASPISGRVISVYAGGMENGTSPDELPIGCPPDEVYGLNSVRKYSTFMKTFMFEELASKYAGRLSLTHIYPGLVDGPGFYSNEMPTWFRWVWWALKPLLSLYMTSPEDCGATMMYLATSRFPAISTKTPSGEAAVSTKMEPGGGAYGVGRTADPPAGVRYEKIRKSDTAKRVWDHTMEILNRIEKRNVASHTSA